MDAVSKWLNESRTAMASMERELRQHNAAVEAAMATIQSHGEAIDRLERSLEIVGKAIAEAEAGLEREHEPKEAAVGRPATLDRSVAPRLTDRPEAPQLRAIAQT